MTIKITTPNGGSDSLDFGCAQTDIVATVTGTEVSSGEGKLELKTTTGGTSATKATVLANGNFGINNASPTGKLDVVGGRSYFAANSDAFATYLRYNNSTAGCFVGSPAANEFQVSASSGTARLNVDSAGNVGINKAAPVTKLHIEGGGTSNPATTGTDPAAGTVLRIRPGNNAILDIGGNGTSGAWLQSYDQTGMQTEYPLLLNPNGGNVGIGTAAPSNKLDIAGAVTATPVTNGIVRIQTTGSNPATGNGGGLLFSQQNSGGSMIDYASITGSRVNQSADNRVDMVFATGDPTGSVAVAERMRITTDGRGLSQFTAKAWINFNGEGTIAIRDSHNVASITDLGFGRYTVTLTNNMANTNYMVSATAGSEISDYAAQNNDQDHLAFLGERTVSLFKVFSVDHDDGTQDDAAAMCCLIFGD